MKIGQNEQPNKKTPATKVAILLSRNFRGEQKICDKLKAYRSFTQIVWTTCY